MNKLRFVTLARIMLYVAYGSVCIYVVSLISTRAPSTAPAPPLATRKLDANHLITRDDLQTDATAELVGRYLRKDVPQSKPITPDIVSPSPLPPRLTNTVAAIVAIPYATLMQRRIAEGMSVLIVRSVQPTAISGKVIKVDCNEQSCSVVVSLPKMPGQIIDPDMFASADIMPAPAAAPKR
jgi:hypothetical protein